MSTSGHIHVRAARDRVIDLLGLGETYPLQDVTVRSEPAVGFGQRASFEIEPGQENVRYELNELREDGSLLPLPCSADGVDGLTTLQGPAITGNTRFRIRAFKIDRPERSAFLLGTTLVKVGIDAGRRAWIQNVPKLHPDLVGQADKDPWIADHGSVVEVRIERAQAGTSYQLEYPGRGGEGILTQPVEATGADLSLYTAPVQEDTLIRIRATRTLGPMEAPEDATGWLKAELPLAVRADPSLAVRIEGSPLVDPAAKATVAIAGSQESAMYSAHVRPLRDGDFLRDGAPLRHVLAVSVPSSLDVPAHEVVVRAPVLPAPGQALAGYTPQGDPSPGNGEEGSVVLGPIHEDSLLVIRAQKQHFASGMAGGQAVIPGESAVWLRQVLVALPRPEEVPDLTLTVSPGPGGKGEAMLVSGGQRGVFYHFRLEENGPEIGQRAYFHRLDEDDPQQNRGIRHLEIGKDLAVARDPSPGPAPPHGAEHAHPPDPIVDIEPLPGDTGHVSVMAVKSRTGVAWAESRPVSVERIPEP